MLVKVVTGRRTCQTFKCPYQMSRAIHCRPEYSCIQSIVLKEVHFWSHQMHLWNIYQAAYTIPNNSSSYPWSLQRRGVIKNASILTLCMLIYIKTGFWNQARRAMNDTWVTPGVIWSFMLVVKFGCLETGCFLYYFKYCWFHSVACNLLWNW